MPAIIAALIIALLGGGTSIAANNSLPGDFLYPVKVDVNEKVAGAFQFSPEAKANWEAKLAEVRLDEAAKLAADSKLSADLKDAVEVAFKAHADAAQKELQGIADRGDAATAASLSGDFEAGLNARHDILDKLKEADKIEVDSEISDVANIRENAEATEKSDAEKSPEGAKNSAEGKINAASNVIDSAKEALNKADLSTSTKEEAQTKLADAEGLLSQAKAKFSAGDYSAAFDLAQEALRAAQEARISGEVQDELNLEEGASTDAENENRSATSSQEENGKDSSSGDKGEDGVKVGL